MARTDKRSQIGRNPVYHLTFIVFWVLTFPTAVVDNFGGLLALRFWLGIFGSPALANGGATIGDMFSLVYIPFGLCWWVFSAWAGPAFGPVSRFIPIHTETASDISPAHRWVRCHGQGLEMAIVGSCMVLLSSAGVAAMLHA